MTDTVKQCPLCGSADHAQFDQRQFRNRLVTNIICQSCGLVFQSPRMDETESQEFYAAEYRLVYQGQPGPNLKDLAVQTSRAQIALEFIRPQVSVASRILDIGCSTGILLHQFGEFYHCQVYGIEPGEVYRQYAQSTGLKVFPSLEALHEADPAPFDLISLMHVLEHLPSPVDYLVHLRSHLLKPDGFLLVEVPNLYAHDCFEIAHLIAFSTHTLQQVMQKAGFRVVVLRTFGQPRSELIPLYITLLATPDANIHYALQPDHRVRLHRQWGMLRRRLVERFFPQRAWLPTE
jgi:2-polyprenyl-3-methyl-5-hydroxy-6-metoxy-1,4-benzoquinol methylase